MALRIKISYQTCSSKCFIVVRNVTCQMLLFTVSHVQKMIGLAYQNSINRCSLLHLRCLTAYSEWSCNITGNLWMKNAWACIKNCQWCPLLPSVDLSQSHPIKFCLNGGQLNMQLHQSSFNASCTIKVYLVPFIVWWERAPDAGLHLTRCRST